MKPTVIITRPKALSAASVTALEAHGFAAISTPMTEIIAQDVTIDLKYDALIFTSINGVIHGGEKLESSAKSRPVFAIGSATASAALEAGFTDVTCADGNGEGLIDLILKTGNPQARYLHLSGDQLAVDVADALQKAGFQADRIICYQANAIDVDLAPLSQEGCLGVLFYSARAATEFEKRLSPSHINDRLMKMTAFCLSDRIQQTLTLPWQKTVIAAAPTEEALIEAVRENHRG